MTENFIGKAVSIKCCGTLGVFQGTIKSANQQRITIVKVFRNGVPLKKPDVEVTLEASNIEDLQLIPQDPLPPVVIAKPTPVVATAAVVTNGMANMKIKNGFRGSPPKNAAVPVLTKTKPMDVPNGNPFKKNRKPQQQKNNRNSAFGTPVDDPIMDEDFDFEGNLALFDKAAIWDEIENGSEKPDLLRQTGQQQQQRKFRHDENVISSKPIQLRQIQTEYKCEDEFVTDDGLIIPCIPHALRQRVQNLAEAYGLTWERQSDLLGRGATELAMLLIGGPRRFVPKNQHQWPTISIICDQPYNEKLSEVGLNTGRQLSSHGLKVMAFVKTTRISERPSRELELYTATGNEFTCDVNDLPASDLIILAVTSTELAANLSTWLKTQKCPILAIDPPSAGIKNATIKYSLLPILPLEGVKATILGKLYLCNLSIPLKFFRDAGIKYSSPFGAKFVIPLHETQH